MTTVATSFSHQHMEGPNVQMHSVSLCATLPTAEPLHLMLVLSLSLYTLIKKNHFHGFSSFSLYTICDYIFGKTAMCKKKKKTITAIHLINRELQCHTLDN